MKKILFAIALLLPGVAQADTCATSLMPLFTGAQAGQICSTFGAGYIGTQANNTYVAARNAANSANLNIWKADTSDNTVLNAGTGKSVNLSIASTPVAGVSSTGITLNASSQQFLLVPAVVTPATNLTPAAGSNDVQPLTIVATAAPTNAAIALPASPVTGDSRLIVNTGANPVVVAALGTPSMNLAVTPGPRRVIMAAKTTLRCTYSGSEASWLCFTGAGALPTPAA